MCSRGSNGRVKLSYTKNGLKKYEPKQLIEFGKQAGFENIEVMEILKVKIYGKLIKEIILTLLIFHGMWSWSLFNIYIKLDWGQS